ncbi:MAG: hypothetical protein IKW49_01915 [Opitutales bacterium]|nr:hypothetical protein [Opitutales bacterium]
MVSEYLICKKTAEDFIQKRDYSAAIPLINELLKKFPLHPELLLMKYSVALFSEGGELLDSLEKILETVASTSPTFSRGNMELGHFLFSVSEKNEQAVLAFESAIKQSTKDLIQAYIGLLKISLEENDMKRKNELIKRIKEIPNDIFFEAGLEIPEI